MNTVLTVETCRECGETGNPTTKSEGLNMMRVVCPKCGNRWFSSFYTTYPCRCGGTLSPTGLYGLLECDGPTCVDNPHSEEAAVDRHRTVAEWERRNK